MMRAHSILWAAGMTAAVGLSVSARTSRSESPGDSLAQVRRAIEAGNATWERAFKNLDAAAMAATFDEDGVNVSADDGGCTKGRAAIEAAMRSYLAISGPATKTKVEIGDVVLDGDFAYEWGRAEFHFAPKPGGPAERSGRYLAVWKRQSDGGWKLFRNLGLPGRP
jgi:uncharacterized protein (TIGR02246 family)